MCRSARAHGCVGRRVCAGQGGAVRCGLAGRTFFLASSDKVLHTHIRSSRSRNQQPAKDGIAQAQGMPRRATPRPPHCYVSASHPWLNREGARLCSACPRRGPAESNGRVLAADTIDASTGAAVCGVYVTLRSTDPRRLGRTVLVGSPSENKVAGFGGRGIGQGGLTQGTSLSCST